MATSLTPHPNALHSSSDTESDGVSYRDCGGDVFGDGLKWLVREEGGGRLPLGLNVSVDDVCATAMGCNAGGGDVANAPCELRLPSRPCVLASPYVCVRVCWCQPVYSTTLCLWPSGYRVH